MSNHLELVHLLLGQSDDGVVVVDGFLHHQAVRAVLALKDGRRQVLVAEKLNSNELILIFTGKQV